MKKEEEKIKTLCRGFWDIIEKEENNAKEILNWVGMTSDFSEGYAKGVLDIIELIQVYLKEE